jgi:hypothetical protein
MATALHGINHQSFVGGDTHDIGGQRAESKNNQQTKIR